MVKELIKRHKHFKDTKDKLNQIRALVTMSIDNYEEVKEIYKLINRIENIILKNQNRNLERISKKKIEIKNLNDMIKYNII